METSITNSSTLKEKGERRKEFKFLAKFFLDYAVSETLAKSESLTR